MMFLGTAPRARTRLHLQGYPVVHSLSVTLSNHTILGNTSYNDPCPKDHPSYDRQTWPMGWPTRR